jgi:hypothetical protein
MTCWRGGSDEAGQPLLANPAIRRCAWITRIRRDSGLCICLRVYGHLHLHLSALLHFVASAMNSFVNDTFEKITIEATKLARINKRLTITSREIQTSVRLSNPGELAKHAVSESIKAVNKYISAS